MSSFEHAVIAYALYSSVEKGFMHFPVPAMEGDEGLFQSPESVAQPQDPNMKALKRRGFINHGSTLGFRGLGFGIGSRFRLGFRVWVLGCISRFRVWDLGFKGLGFRVWGWFKV